MKKTRKAISVILSAVLILLVCPRITPDAVFDNTSSGEIDAIASFLSNYDQEGTNAEKLGYDISDTSTWSGVTFENGRVTDISLEFCRTVGEINLSGFSKLKNLNLIFNNIEAVDLTGCTSLVSFRIANNLLSGMPDLSDCTELEELELSGNDIGGVFDFSDFPKLKTFMAYGCSLTGITSASSAVLNKLCLSNNSFTGTLDLTGFTGLHELDVIENKITSLSARVLNDNDVSCLINLGTDGYNGGYVGYYCGYMWDILSDTDLFTVKCAASGEDNVGFAGWYNGAVKLSNEFEYEMPAVAAINYTAHFGTKTVNAYELGKLKSFFELTDDSGKTNASYAGFNANDASTWLTSENEPVFYTDLNGHITELNIGGFGLFGILDLTNFSRLSFLCIDNNTISGLTLTGCGELNSLIVNNTDISSLDLSPCEKLESLEACDILLNSLNIGTIGCISNVSMRNTRLSSIDFSTLGRLEFLEASGNNFRSVSVLFDGATHTITSDNNLTLDVSLSAYSDSFITAVPSVGYSLGGWYETESSQTAFSSDNPLRITPDDFPAELIAKSITASPTNYEISAIRSFLNSTDRYGNTNASKLSDVSANDYTTWNFVKWTASGAKMNVEEIDLNYCGLTGNLNVSGFSKLKVLRAENNSLTGLSVSGCSALEQLDAGNNSELGSLDLSDCTRLQGASLYHSGLTQLTAENLSELGWIDFNGNENLIAADISGCANLDLLNAGWCPLLTSLDYSGCNKITRLFLEELQLPSQLDLSIYTLSVLRLKGSFTEITFKGEYNYADYSLSFTADSNSEITALTFGTQWDEGLQMDVPKYTVEGDGTDGYMFDYWYNEKEAQKIESTDNELSFEQYIVTGGVSLSLHSKTIELNQTEIDVMTDFFNEGSPELSNADKLGVIANDPSTWGNFVTWNKANISSIIIDSYGEEEYFPTGELDVSGFSKLIDVHMSNCFITGFTAVNCPQLTNIDIWNSALTSPVISGCARLESLNIGDSDLTSFDASSLSTLRFLNLSNNPLTALDITGCDNLEELRIEKCAFTGSLDFSLHSFSSFFYSGTEDSFLDSLKFNIYRYGVSTPISLSSDNHSYISEVSYGYNWNERLQEDVFEDNISAGAEEYYSFDKWFDAVSEEVAFDTASYSVSDLLESGKESVKVVSRDYSPNAAELEVINSFLSFSDGVSTNAEKIGVTVGNPNSWSQFISWDGDNIGYINFSQENLMNEDNRLKGTLDISGFSRIRKIDIHNTDITSLIADNCPELVEIFAWYSRLSEISFTNCQSLLTVDFWHNEVTELTLSGVPRLEGLNCAENKLSDLSVPYGNYFYFVVNGNPLTHVTVIISEMGNAVEINGVDGAYIGLNYQNGEWFALGNSAEYHTFSGWANSEDGDVFSTEQTVALNNYSGSVLYAKAYDYGVAERGGMLRVDYEIADVDMLTRALISGGICDFDSVIIVKDQAGDIYTGRIKTSLIVTIVDYFGNSFDMVLSVLGDIDGNGTVDSADKALMTELCLSDTVNSNSPTIEQRSAADIDDDTVVDVIDMVLLSRI